MSAPGPAGADHVLSVLDVPAEWWERALEGWRGWWAHHAGFARAVVRAQRVVSTVALVLGVIALVVVPRLALGLVPAVFMTGCLLVVGLLARTRTVGLRPLLLLMGISVPWSLLIAHATRAIGESIGLSTIDDGARIALAAFVEEPGKLLPLLLLAVVAPGRMRRMAAVDWALLGFATGAGFTIAEDGARRLAPPGMLAELLGENRLHYSLNPWTAGVFQLSGGSWAEQILGIDAAPAGPMTTGHQVPTMGVAMGVALGLALWRTARPWWRALAWLPPAAMLTMAIVDHACYNATVGWAGWADQDTAIPTWIRLAWQVRGQGHTQIAVSVALFITCMLVDARRRHRAGVFGDVALEAPKAPDLPMTGIPAAARVPAQALVWLAAYTWSDLVIIAAAYGDRTLTRRARMAEGRAMGVQVRGVRQDAMTVTTPGTEPAARNTFRLISLAVAAVMLAVCWWYGTALAQDIGSWLRQEDWPFFFAGLLDGLAQWWDSLGMPGQILVTALAVLFLTWGGLSVATALGAVGVGTWALSHGRGIATFLQDPATATRSYATNATWEQVLLDGLDFALTFIPGSALGLGTRKAARTAAENVTLTRTARRNTRTLTHQTSRTTTRTWTEQGVRDWINDLQPVVRKPSTTAIQYQHRVLGTDVERVIPTGVGDETIIADAVTADGNLAIAFDTKYTKGGSGSLYEGGRPEFLYKDFDREIRRYGQAIRNPNNPLGGLTIVTNTDKAAEFLGQRARSILGPDFPLIIRVVP
ncbi:hypothetical protein [Actinomyces ruminicola]|uniref:hypothetical protein n=1 Tax=Actinomyces ruminicola TaxID=332524 RepID=UPI0011C8575A|nr:hypothetical protein [Actinomyces ruminicola]